jgi:heat shock protein HslJ
MKKFVLLVLLFCLAACDGEFKMSDVAGKWQLSTMNGQPIASMREGGVTLDIQEDGKFAGQAPVNRYFGQIKVEDKTLKTGPIGSTMMAGPPENMQAEQQYFQALGENVKSANIENGQLVITAMDDKKLVFDRVK